MLPLIQCVQCGTQFQPVRKDQRFCSRRCNQNFYRDSSVVACLVTDCGRPMRARGLCSKHYKAQNPNRKAWKKNGNPEVRRASLRRKTQQRRARTKGDSDAELIDRDEIGDRDGWRCGLCLKSINRALPYPDPRSASLDHIVPLAKGGKHLRVNVQITHLSCNIDKRDRVADVQPLLIG